MSAADLMHAPVASLVEAAERAGIPFYLTEGGLVIRPVRNADADTELLRATLAARRDEVVAYLRSYPRARVLTEDEQHADADRIALAVFGLPWEIVTRLVISQFARWTREAYDGRLTYEPPALPHWDDDLVHDEPPISAPKGTPRRRPAPPIANDRVVY